MLALRSVRHASLAGLGSCIARYAVQFALALCRVIKSLTRTDVPAQFNLVDYRQSKRYFFSCGSLR